VDGAVQAAKNCERARSEPTWTARELAGSHDLMIDRPDEVAAILLRAG
jgi:hypothetical protein